jgi:glycosyltransferase involved in cell wall biosynthesis
MNSRHRIMHIITGLETGGAERMLVKLLGQPNSADLEPIVVSMMGDGMLGTDIRALGIPLYTLDMRQGLPSVGAYARLAELVRRLRPDLVHGWMYHGNLAALAAAGAFSQRIPVVWNVRHSLTDIRREKWLTRGVIRANAWLSPRANRIVFNSHRSADQHTALGFSSTQTVVIPNGFNVEEFHPDPAARIDVRKELGLDKDTFLVGIVGRYHPMKDHRSFLHAAATLGKRHKNIAFVLVGKGVDEKNQPLGAAIAHVRRYAKVHLLGERRDIPRLTAALDVAVSASAWGEGFPNVIGEAMACGIPCVVTDVGDSAWVVGRCGRVVPSGEPGRLANAIAELLRLNAHERARLAEQARERIVSEFCLASVASQYERLHQSAITEFGAPAFAR